MRACNVDVVTLPMRRCLPDIECPTSSADELADPLPCDAGRLLHCRWYYRQAMVRDLLDSLFIMRNTTQIYGGWLPAKAST